MISNFHFQIFKLQSIYWQFFDSWRRFDARVRAIKSISKHNDADDIISWKLTDCNFVWFCLEEKPMKILDRWSDKHRKDTYIALKYQKPKKPTDVKFPTNLVLGPEQLDAINSDADFNLVIGEAGSGKTTVLLAVLFKHTGKHLKHRDLRKALFIIPEKKVAFTKYVQWFINEYCVPDCVYLRNFSNLPPLNNCYSEMLKVHKTDQVRTKTLFFFKILRLRIAFWKLWKG